MNKGEDPGGKEGSWLILPAYVGAFPDKPDVPGCPECRTTKFVAAMVDEADATTACVSCENGHAWFPSELIRVNVTEATSAESYTGKAMGRAVNVWMNEFWIEITGSTDRALAILSGAMLDEVLGILLSALAIDEALLMDRLLRPDRPLGTFGGRIDACYLFGLISEREWRALRIVKDTGNAFAHKLENLSFRDGAMRDRARAVVRELHLRGPQEGDGRKLFQVAVGALWTSLVGKVSLVVRVARMPFEPTVPMIARHVGRASPAAGS